MTRHDRLIHSASGAVSGLHRKILITTTDTVPGRTIRVCKGIVRGNTIRARHIGSDILALLRNIVGGEIREYTKLIGESREQAMDRMAEQALRLDATAIVGMRFTTSTLMNGAAELLAYGTAVELEDDNES